MIQVNNNLENFIVTQGDEGFEKHMDRLMELSEYLVKRIKEMPEKYYLIMEPEMVNVSFWYIPPRLRNVPHSAEKERQLGEVRSILNFKWCECEKKN